MTNASVATLSTCAPSSDRLSASQYGQLLLITRIGISTAGSAPISPAAKLSTVLVRYTSVMPTAIRAYVSPVIMPRMTTLVGMSKSCPGS